MPLNRSCGKAIKLTINPSINSTLSDRSSITDHPDKLWLLRRIVYTSDSVYVASCYLYFGDNLAGLASA